MGKQIRWNPFGDKVAETKSDNTYPETWNVPKTEEEFNKHKDYQKFNNQEILSKEARLDALAKDEGLDPFTRTFFEIREGTHRKINTDYGTEAYGDTTSVGGGSSNVDITNQLALNKVFPHMEKETWGQYQERVTMAVEHLRKNEPEEYNKKVAKMYEEKAKLDKEDAK